MHTFVFLDTETTGIGPKDRLCQLAFKTPTETFCKLYKPPLRIPPEASAVTHITNKMVESCVPFQESEDYARVKELLEDEHTIVVCHNAPFDISMLEKENIHPQKYICSLKAVRYLDKEARFSQYNLQYLRYFLELEIEARAHDALGDVLVLEKFFEYLMVEMIKQTGSKESAIALMLDVTQQPTLISAINFGKHNGKKVAEVAAEDPGYLEWLLSQKLQKPEGEEDWIYTLQFHLKKG